jgi:L-asparaginase II
MPVHALPSHVPIVVASRGGFPENIHYGSVAVVDREGALLASVGDVESPMFTRSCLKPFQAMPLISQWADRYQLDEADVALLCASHSGEPMHVSRVTSLLARAGADASSLACGCHTPFFYSATGQAPASGERFGPLQHNCSGKHSGMLMLAQALGAPMADYLHVDHPVQQEILQSVSHFSGVAPGQLVRGTDGCSAPNYAMPLKSLAHAFARLTSVTPDPVYGLSPLRVAKAMSKHPELVSGQGRNDLALMRAGGGDWVSKVGADGVQVLASFRLGVAIAAKCSDGMLSPLMVAVVAVLDQLGWLDDQRRLALGSLLPPALRNAAGVAVGDMRPALQLRFAR